MSYNELQATIEAAFESRANITAQNASAEVRAGVETALGGDDPAQVRAGRVEAPVEELLQLAQVGFGLVHARRESQAGGVSVEP